jgi:hypothetical protein
MTRIVWFFLSLAGAFFWFSCACGFITPSAWMVTFAFAVLGVGSITNAIKELVS